MVVTRSVLVYLVDQSLHGGLIRVHRSILPRSKSCSLCFHLYLQKSVVDYAHKLVIIGVAMVLELCGGNLE